MLEQWEADRLLAMRKIYSFNTVIDLSIGVSRDYQLEDVDGNEFFLLDIWRGKRNRNKARFQLRYGRDIILARLCTSIPHTNPDGSLIEPPHFHSYREEYECRYAETVNNVEGPVQALTFFCEKINLPIPDIQGGLQ
jgi:hypothetical protein